MYYSLTFKVNNVTKNTWSDWKLIPNTPPMVNFPDPDLTYVDVPGREDGPLDLTGVHFGHLTYKRITGSWTFLRDPESNRTRWDLYEAMNQYFNGKTGSVVFEEDPNHFYYGRFSVEVPRTGTGPIQFTIRFDLAPTRYNTGDTVTIYTPDGQTVVLQGIHLEYDSQTQDLRITGFS